MSRRKMTRRKRIKKTQKRNRYRESDKNIETTIKDRKI